MTRQQSLQLRLEGRLEGEDSDTKRLRKRFVSPNQQKFSNLRVLNLPHLKR